MKRLLVLLLLSSACYGAAVPPFTTVFMRTLLDDATVATAQATLELTEEHIEDWVGGMLGGTETFISVTYQDASNDIDFVVPVKDEDNMTSDSDTHLATQQSIKAYVDAQAGSLTQEEVEDYVGGMLDGTETLITVTYQDAAGNIDFVVDDDLSQYDNATSAFITLLAEFNPLLLAELSADPDKPTEGKTKIWMSDGTQYGDDGDLIIAATAGGTTKRGILWDFSGASEWVDFLLLETGDALLLEGGDKLILE